MRKTTLLAMSLFAAFASNGQGCSDLFFSEYSEGSGNNKYIELYNPTSSAISLVDYEVKAYNNGGTSVSNSISFPASATIAAHGTYVIANSGSDATILAFADTTSTVTYFNGDDAIVLFNGTDTLDIIGVVGVDPGSNWTVGTGSTGEHTLVRKTTVDQGTTNWSVGATQWDVYAQNTWSYGGAHTSNCGGSTGGSYPVVAINTFNSVDANGVADSLGAMKWIKGIVTSIDFDGNAGYSFYVQDATAGINIYNYADVGTYTSPMMGDSLYIHGEVDQYNGLTELKPDSIVLANAGNTLPAPAVVTSLYESIEGSLVKVENVTLVTPSQWPASGSANVDFTNGTDTMTMRIDSDTDIDGSTAPTGTFSVVGVVGQYDFSSPYTSGYQLFPRQLTDIMTQSVTTPTFNGVVGINTFNSTDANGVADSAFAMKWIKGIVTSIDFDGNAGYSFYVQDATGGINIYNFSDVSGYTAPMMGDSLFIYGEVQQYNGLLELVPDSIYAMTGTYALPTPAAATALDESTESILVQFTGFELVDPTHWPASGSNANVEITNGTDTLTMRIDSDTDIDGSAAPTGMFDVTGIGSQYDNSSPYTEGYQLFPRQLTDIYEYPTIPMYDIADVTYVDAAGMPDSNGVVCKLEGIVMGVDMQGSSSSVSFTIHDGVDGISTYSSVPAAAAYNVTEGDEVRIVGSIGQYNGLLQMYVDSIAVLSTGNTLPTTPTVVTTLSEATESELITFENATLVDPAQWGSGSSGYTVDITNGSDTIVMRIDADVDLYGTPAPVGTFNVTGIGGQFTFNAADFDGYQILPRYTADIVAAAPANVIKLAVTEIMASSNSSGINADWFEIHNYGMDTVDLTGFSWDDESEAPGTSVFPSVSIAPGHAIVVLDDVASTKSQFETEWKAYVGTMTIITNDEVTGSFPSLSANGDGVFLYDDNGVEITNSVYTAANAGYSIEFDTTGTIIGDAVDGTNGAYTSLLGDVGSPANMTPNSNVGEAQMVSGLFPNPSNGAFTVEFANSVDYTVEMFSITGARIMSEAGNGSAIQITADVAPGTYLVQVTTAAGAEEHMVVIK